jgi:diguanylate cyclase (GGDEF)-like protein
VIAVADIPTQQCVRFLSEIFRSLKSTNRYEEVLHLIVDRIVRMYHCQTCAIVLIDPKTEYLHIDNFHGLSLTFCNAFRRTIATASVGKLLWTGEPVVIAHAATQQELATEMQLERPFASCLAVQIAADHRTLGYLYVDSRETSAFAASDIELLQMFADAAGMALFKSQLYEENLRLDRIDRETGLEKYLPFLERVKASMARAQEFRENFAVMILDVDNFKSVVNTYGYDASRQLLKEMADILRSRLRPIDASARYGFDEFIVLVANHGLEEALSFAREVRKEIEEARFTKHGIRSTVSTGVAAYPQNGTTSEDLILTAKKALFEAQRTGRNNVFAFPSHWYATEPTHTA